MDDDAGMAGGTTRWRALTALATSVAAAVSATACAQLPFGLGHPASKVPVRPASLEAEHDLQLLQSPSVGLASPEDAVVRVVGPKMTCSGTLVAEDLVLTAHHCVVERGARGEFTPKLVAATAVQVELGGDYLPWGNVGLKAILAPPCGEAGGQGDVAILVLERKLVGMPTLSLHEDPPRAGQFVAPEGFGRCALSAEGIRRRDRDGGPVSAVSTGTFEVQASVCPGDSGGPVIDRASSEVIGVVSLSAMDYDESTRARSVFARVDEMPKLVAYGRLVADGADPGDMPPLSCDK
jgi:hypothetical protein